MKRQLLFIIALMASFSLAQGQIYYASPNGGSGGCTSGSPCSLAATQALVRTVNSNMTEDITIILQGGTYDLSGGPLLFTSADGGTNGHHVIWKAADGAEVNFSGGQEITGWTSVGNGIFKANIGTLRFRQLYVNDARAIRARTPNKTSEDTGGPYYQTIRTNTNAKEIEINASEISNWARLNEVELHTYVHWYSNILRLSSFSTSGSSALVKFQDPEGTRFFDNISGKGGDWDEDWPYHFENALEFLDAINEWYINSDDNHLYFMPAGGSMSDKTIIAPKEDILINIDGTSATSLVSNLIFDGIKFKHSNYTGPNSHGVVATQGAENLVSGGGSHKIGMVTARHASNLIFKNCEFSNAGVHGITFKNNVKNSEISDCVFKDIAGNGIYLGSNIGRTTTDDNRVSEILVKNNLVERVARDYTNGIGIMATFVKNVTIENNEIRNNRYMGIQVGGQTQGIDAGMDNNIIQFNRVHDVMKFHDDGGGIYTLGRQDNSKIFENWIYNIARGPYAGTSPVAGIYHDNFTENYTTEHNVLNNVQTSGNRDYKIFLQEFVGAGNVTTSDVTLINNDTNDQCVKDGSGIGNIGNGCGGASTLPEMGVGRMEAENMFLNNYIVEGSRIMMPAGKEGDGRYKFTGTSGTYNIEIGYIAEDDGQALHKVFVNNVQADSWTAPLGTFNLVTRTVAGVNINTNDIIQIYGKQVAGSHARVDYVEVSAASTNNLVIEAEDALLSGNFSVINNSAASGDQYVVLPNGQALSGSIDFTFTVDQAGLYQLKGFGYAPSGSDNSFWVSINGGSSVYWNLAEPNTTFSEDWVNSWNVTTAFEDPLQVTLNAGTVNVRLFAREDGVGLDKLELVLIQASSSPDPVLVLEAESGTINGVFVVTDNLSASNLQYVLAPPTASVGGSNITLNFTVTEPGIYQIKGWGYAPSGTDNSFWVSVNGGAEGWWEMAEPNTNFSFDWVNEVGVSDPRQWNLNAGTVTVNFRGRENGAGLDKVELVKVSAARMKKEETEVVLADDPKTGLSIYPNPTYSSITIEYIAQNEKPVLLFIRNVNGQQVHSQLLEKKDVIDVSRWKSGVYFIEVLDSDTKKVKKLIVH